MEDKETIKQTLETIEEIGKLYDSDNIVVINQLCNRLSNLSVTVGWLVSSSEKLWRNLDEEYDYELDRKKLELVEAGNGVAKAESMAKVALYQKKKEATEAEVYYNRLKRFLGRIDKVLESNKQYTSTVKTSNLKNVN